MAAASDVASAKSETAGGEEDHYVHVAASYEKAYFYDQSNKTYQNFLADSLQKSLQCKPGQDVVDLGGGTGHFTEWFASRAGIDIEKACCVDPSAAMIEVASKRKGLGTSCESAQDFIGHTDLQYDRLFLKEVVHHIPSDELQEVFNGVQRQLRDDGRMSIITRMPTSEHYPFFEAAHKVWVDNQEHYDTYADMLRKSGLEVDVAIRDFEVRMPKEAWIGMVRSRFWSTFSHFSDKELEAGIKELEARFKGEEEVVFPDRLVFITGIKGPASGTLDEGEAKKVGGK